MRHERAETIEGLLSLVHTLSDKLNNTNQGIKINVYPRVGTGCVIPYFEYKDPNKVDLARGGIRLSAKQVARNFGMSILDFKLYPEKSLSIYNSNADKLDKLRDLWLKVAGRFAEGLSPVEKNKIKNKQMLFDYITAIKESALKQGKDTSHYLSLLKQLPKAGCQDRPICLVDVKYCKQFVDYLNNGNFHGNTPLEYSKHLKRVLRMAVVDNLIDSNPFDKIPKQYLPKSTGFDNTQHLTREQLRQFEDFFHSLPVPEPPEFFVSAEFHFWESARIFLFSCYTGLRISDIEQLTDDSIIKDGNHYHISKKIQKTQTPTFKTLHPKAVALLSLYKDENHYFKISRRTLNRNIRLAVKLAGITLHFQPSIHKARHTFATILAENGAQPQTIQFQLDHKTPTMALRYAGVTQKMADDALKAFD